VTHVEFDSAASRVYAGLDYTGRGHFKCAGRESVVVSWIAHDSLPLRVVVLGWGNNWCFGTRVLEGGITMQATIISVP